MRAELVTEDGRRLLLDEHGHLADWHGWCPAVARAFAVEEGLDLTPEHVQVLQVFRDYFERYSVDPPMRALLQILSGNASGRDWRSRDLYRLFPQSPARQGSRLAGLPKPLSCI